MVGIDQFGGGVPSNVNTLAHTLIASVTSDPISVTLAELSFVVGVIGQSDIGSLALHSLV
jgi:hypothetical protein